MRELASLAQAAIARRHVKRAAGQLREAARLLAQLEDGDGIAAVLHLRRDSDLERVRAAAYEAIQRYGDVDVVIAARTTNTPTPATRQGEET